jgi:clathrin heavy chain
MRKTNYLPLIEQFLRSVQNTNLSAVNEALDEIFIENDDHESLRSSVLEYDNYDQLGLAKKIESHPLLEFRRIAALVYRNNKKFLESINLSKKDHLYKVNYI